MVSSCGRYGSGRLKSASNQNSDPNRQGGSVQKILLRRRDAYRNGRVAGEKTLGELLRVRRHELGLTQRELAAKLGVQPAHVAYLELDRRRPSLSLLERIAQALDLNRERLILISHPEARNFFPAHAEVEAPAGEGRAWRDFQRNKALLARHKVTSKELKILSQVALLGRINNPRTFLFVLNSIRQAVGEE
jgi:transcriptional regulator with XRE-family HTH domain